MSSPVCGPCLDVVDQGHDFVSDQGGANWSARYGFAPFFLFVFASVACNCANR